jgi:AcrR family transcriptional regulator
MIAEPKSARHRILETAHDLFYRDGVRATGVDRLIAEARVTKVTFYRHFPSKDDLIRAFLEYRHEKWMRWFREALTCNRLRQNERARRDEPLAPLAAALAEWFAQPSFRGCAFINSVAEIGGALPDATAIAARHKAEMIAEIETLLPQDRTDRAIVAQAAALAADGAIVRAQISKAASRDAVASLRHVLGALTRLHDTPPAIKRAASPRRRQKLSTGNVRTKSSRTT